MTIGNQNGDEAPPDEPADVDEGQAIDRATEGAEVAKAIADATGAAPAAVAVAAPRRPRRESWDALLDAETRGELVEGWDFGASAPPAKRVQPSLQLRPVRKK